MVLEEFMQSAKRILIVSRKPNQKEFLTMSQITGLGIFIIGFIGFLIILIFTFTGLGK